MAKPKTITLKAKEVVKKEDEAPSPLTALRDSVNDNQLDFMTRSMRSEAFVVVSDLYLQMALVDEDIRRAKKSSKNAIDKSYLVAGLEGERLGLEKAIKRIIDRHWPLGNV